MHQSISPENRYSVVSLLKMLRPHRVLGRDKMRIGRLFDGGYVMLDSLEGVTAAYSLGINDDVSWDLDIARRGIPVYQYDHTIDGLPEPHPLFSWKKVGISWRRDEENGMETIESLLQGNGHADATDLILKCDIEGSEWEVFRHTPATVLKQFRQIVIEVHNLNYLVEWPHCENVRATFTNLFAHHRVVHVHGNNYAPWVILNGIPVPINMEFTLVRKDEGEFVVSDEIFPTELDMPCDSGRADHYLGRFEFH